MLPNLGVFAAIAPKGKPARSRSHFREIGPRRNVLTFHRACTHHGVHVFIHAHGHMCRWLNLQARIACCCASNPHPKDTRVCQVEKPSIVILQHSKHPRSGLPSIHESKLSLSKECTKQGLSVMRPRQDFAGIFEHLFDWLKWESRMSEIPLRGNKLVKWLFTIAVFVEIRTSMKPCLHVTE